MSTPEHPATPALTRKQIRELRNTGSTPVITAPSSEDAGEPPVPAGAVPPIDAALSTPAPAAPFPRPSEPAPVAPAPVPDATVDLGVSPLTRRQARQQERIRTASVPVITPEVVAAHAAAAGGGGASVALPETEADAPSEHAAPQLFTTPQDDAKVSTDSGMHALFGITRDTENAQSAGPVEPVPVIEIGAATPETEASESEAPETATPETEAPATEATEAEGHRVDDIFADGAETVDEDADGAVAKAVNPLLGASLLDAAPSAGQPSAVDIPPSFDELLARSSGAVAVPNTLIVSQAPDVAALVGPVTATGEVIITGTFNLPEGLGSTGHAKGTTDGKEIDATLVDGELPSHSSPTPIAASAAVSTVKTPGEVIKPPTPEKGGKLMMSLAITAGVLALALVGVLILAFVTGVF